MAYTVLMTAVLVGSFALMFGLVKFSESIISSFFDPTIASIASFGLLMGILIVRPQGLLPYRM